MYDELGRPLEPNEDYIVPATWDPPKSRIHGKKAGKVYQYSRLDGRKVRFTGPESLLLWRAVQQAPMSVENPVDAAAYLYGEFGVRNHTLALYNKQHMRSRLVTMCETRVNRGLPIEGRARMFLPLKHPLRREYEEDKVAWRAEEAARLVRVKREEEELSDGYDEYDEFDDGMGQLDAQSEVDRRSDEEEDDYDEPAPPPPKRRRRERSEPQRMPVNRAYVEIPVRRRTRQPSEPRSDIERDSDSDDAPRYHRRRHADFAHVPAFDVPSPPAEVSSSPEPEPERRRQSAPGRMRGARAGPSWRTANDEVEDPIVDFPDIQEEDEPAAEPEPEPVDEIGEYDADVQLPPDLESEEEARSPGKHQRELSQRHEEPPPQNEEMPVEEVAPEASDDDDDDDDDEDGEMHAVSS
jgi:hypothetical protein